LILKGPKILGLPQNKFEKLQINRKNE